MNKKILIPMLIIALLLLPGCEKYQDFKKKMPWYEENVTEEIIPVEEEECPECPDCGADLDAVIYYFDEDIYEGLKNFIEEADEKLDCAFIRLDADQFTDLLVEKYEDLDSVRILFDLGSTMDCTTACIPYSISQYNSLFGEGLDVRTIKDLHQNFCASEEGIFITSSLLDNKDRSDHAMFIKSDQLLEIYQNRFNELWVIENDS